MSSVFDKKRRIIHQAPVLKGPQLIAQRDNERHIFGAINKVMQDEIDIWQKWGMRLSITTYEPAIG